MPETVYTQNLNGNGAILKQRIDKYFKVEDLLSCRDELFLQQSVLEDRVEEYADALESGDKGKKAAWGEIVSNGAREVINSKEKMAKIDQWRAQHITRETLFMIVRNIADLLYETFAIDDASTEKVADIVSSIEAGVLGVSTKEVSESELWSEMVNTVPLLESE
jgi:hypothetical protein